MLLLWLVLILAVKRGGWPCATDIPMTISMFLSLPLCALDSCGNHRGEYILEIPTNFHFYQPEKAIELA